MDEEPAIITNDREPFREQVVRVPVDQFLKLLEFAEEALDLQDSEFGNYATEEEVELLTSLHKRVNKEISPRLARLFERSRKLRR